MTTSSDDGEFEENHDPTDESAAGDDAPEDLETTDPKPTNIIHINDIIANADEMDQQRKAEGKMTFGRYRDISGQIADGQDPQLSETEQAQYDETHESMQEMGRNISKSIVGPNSDIVKSFVAPYVNINKKLAESIALNAGIQNAFKQSTKPIFDFQNMMKPTADKLPKPYEPPAMLTRPTPPSVPDFSQMFDNSEQLRSIGEANKARNKREEADRQVAAAHLEATQQIVQAALDETKKAEDRESARKIEAKRQETIAARWNTILTIIAGLTLIGTAISVTPTIVGWFTR